MIISCFTALNIGFMSIALAFLVGVLMGGMSVSDVLKGFPVSLFVLLIGV
jgi:hypothetical protein